MMKLGARAAAVGVALVAVIACGRIPATHYYVIEIAPAPGQVEAARGLVVGVKPFHVDPPYDQDKIVYRVGAGSPEISFYAYHRWASPLSRMLPAAAAAALAGTAGVAAVDPVTPGGTYDAFLDGRLLTLEEIDEPDGQRVHLRLALSLHLEDGTEIWQGQGRGERAVQSAEVTAVAEAASAALGDVLAGLRPGLESALARRQAAD